MEWASQNFPYKQFIYPMLLDQLQNYRLYLVSKSPRRAALLKSMDIDFEVLVSDVNETYDDSFTPEQVAEYLSEIKLTGVDRSQYPACALFVTCDTIVVVGDRILGKPKDASEATDMLALLSGREHRVITGITVATPSQQLTAHKVTYVQFDDMSDDEIAYYVNRYAPTDKAGAYGVQEWIGCVGIKSISGSFYNVMGLPTKLLWNMLKQLLAGENAG